MRYKETQRNEMGFWLLVILPHITAINLDKIKKHLSEGTREQPSRQIQERSLHLEEGNDNGKFPISGFYQKARFSRAE